MVARYPKTTCEKCGGPTRRRGNRFCSRACFLNGPSDFWSRVLRSSQPDECWIWVGWVRPDGYGQMAWRGDFVLAHRISWELSNGKPPADLNVLHRCDNPPCVRPDHLFLGTPADNSRDMVAKGRTLPSKGELNHHSKLKESQVREILERRRGGETQSSIAKHFGRSLPCISHICLGLNWRHVWEEMCGQY